MVIKIHTEYDTPVLVLKTDTMRNRSYVAANLNIDEPGYWVNNDELSESDSPMHQEGSAFMNYINSKFKIQK